MNQKGFVNIIVIALIVVLIGVGGYFVLVRQATIPSEIQQPPFNTSFKRSPVVVESISPSSGSFGTKVIIRGSGFTSMSNDVAITHPRIDFQGRNTAYLNRIPSPDGAMLSFNIPDNDSVLLGACALSQLKPNEACPDVGILLLKGTVQISVVNKNGTSNSVTFTVK